MQQTALLVAVLGIIASGCVVERVRVADPVYAEPEVEVHHYKYEHEEDDDD